MADSIKYSLNGSWQLYFVASDEYKIRTPDELLGSHLQPIPAIVPGNVELDLVRAGLLPEPFEGDNIYLLRPFENYSE